MTFDPRVAAAVKHPQIAARLMRALEAAQHPNAEAHRAMGIATLADVGTGGGTQGPKGDPGTNGTDGEPGTDGRSAYEIARDHGYGGTETQWIASLTTTVPPAGTRCTLLVLTSGTTSRTLTFGTNFRAVGTLATGTTSGRVFAVSFVSDGSVLYETGRTAAMVA